MSEENTMVAEVDTEVENQNLPDHDENQEVEEKMEVVITKKSAEEKEREFLVQREAEITKRYKRAVPGTLRREIEGNHANKLTVEINCTGKRVIENEDGSTNRVDCENTRRVATSDLHQVKLCEECIKESRLGKRRKKAKIARLERRKAREAEAAKHPKAEKKQKEVKKPKKTVEEAAKEAKKRKLGTTVAVPSHEVVASENEPTAEVKESVTEHAQENEVPAEVVS